MKLFNSIIFSLFIQTLFGQNSIKVKTDTLTYGEGFEFIVPVKLLEENNAYEYFSAANDYFKNGNLKQANKLVNKAIKIDGSNPDFYLLKAWISTENLEYSDAILSAEKAFKIAPNDWRTSYCKGYCKFAQGDFLGATVDYTKVLALNETSFLAYEGRAAAKMQLKNYQSALEDYNITIMLKPAYSKAYFGRGLSKYNLGMYEEAIIDFTSVIVKDSQNGMAYYYKGLCEKATNQIAASCMNLQKALGLGIAQAKEEMKAHCFR
jgi:tetratricopeptide (TPR) repeat protein